MDRLSAISDAGSFSAVLLEHFSVPLTLGRGQTGPLPLSYNPTLGRIIKLKHVCGSYLFTTRTFLIRTSAFQLI